MHARSVGDGNNAPSTLLLMLHFNNSNTLTKHITIMMKKIANFFGLWDAFTTIMVAVWSRFFLSLVNTASNT